MSRARRRGAPAGPASPGARTDGGRPGGLLHIASLLVQHRQEAADRLDALIASRPGTELALRAGGRSIVLCEGVDESSLLADIDALGSVEGVITVSLVHHHAEPAEQLHEEVADDHAA